MNKYYTPHKFQRLFHASKAKLRLVDTGRQTGKTLSGTIETIWHAEHGRSNCCNVLCRFVKEGAVCTKCDNACTLVPIRAWVVAPTYKMLDDINITMMKEWTPHWFNDGWSDQKKRLVAPNGSIIEFRSAEDPDKLRGPTLDYLWGDEVSFWKPIAYEIVSPATVVKNANIVLTTTPKGRDWVYRDFYSKAHKVYTVKDPTLEKAQEPYIVDFPNGDPDIEAFHYRSYDVQHISPKFIEAEKRKKNEQMFRQEYMATFETFVGLVYPDFSEEIHVIDSIPFDADLRESDLNYFIGVDVGWNNPTAILLIAEDPDHNLYVVDEHYSSHMLAPDIADVLDKFKAGRRVVDIIIDPASKGTHQTSGGMSMYDQISEFGHNMTPGDNGVLAGINRVTQLMKERVNDGETKLYVLKKCENLIREFGLYVWAEHRDPELNQKEEPKKMFDHALDALRYVVMSRPDWSEHVVRDRYGREVQEYGVIDGMVDELDDDML